MLAFLSYQTEDRHIAAQVCDLLSGFGVASFMAHEHIEVSADWQSEILQKLEAADLFVPLLSARYYSSVWCLQELGVACFRKITIIPLSIDGSIPQGFSRDIQSTKIGDGGPTLSNLVPGLAKGHVSAVVDVLVEKIGKSGSFRGAEANFEMVLPYLPKATDEQTARLLHLSVRNGQVCHASLCATEYLPPLLASHGNLMAPAERDELAAVLKGYAKSG
jgi:hypothetical protein